MNTKRLARRAQAGFSLAEMMVVIVIIGLLATLVVPNVMRKLFQANETIIATNCKSIAGAVQEYAIDHGYQYPDTLDQLYEEDSNGQAYLSGGQVPKDPYGFQYLYEPPSDGDNFRVYSLGKDGAPGGEGDNKDIDQHWKKGEED
ncbi:MAG: type II secretion system major pseudopilin GspG [Planctomycetota bacterium]|nr:type II secretion system major pseudopilin GspG [Planctomycetota bacterium]